MRRTTLSPTAWLSVAALSSIALGTGCRSPYYADRGAGLGALAGAGTGAIIGDAVGNTGAGVAIGAGLGALTGAAVGQGLDDVAAQNRAEIQAQLGRQVQAGAATVGEVVNMTRAGVDTQLIRNYVRTSGFAGPISASDVIALHNQGVATEVIQELQNPPAPVAVAQRQPVIVEEYHYSAPYCGPRFHYHAGHHRRPRVGFGVHIAK
ncbi:MAG: glycine zipper domain-containing protein [Planctomycetota bacterium]